MPGMPTYGRTFTLSNPNNFKVNSPASAGGKAGEYTKESGFLAYYEVILIKNVHRRFYCDILSASQRQVGFEWSKKK